MKVYCCKKFNKDKHAFTLVEILVVVAIMALLAAITLPVFFNMRTNDRKSTCASNMEAMGRALTEYYQDYKKYPPGPRPDYAMKVWAGSSDAFKAIPLSNQPNRGYPPIYNAVAIPPGYLPIYTAAPLPPMETTPGVNDMSCNPHTRKDIVQSKYTVTILDGSTDMFPNSTNRFVWTSSSGASGGPTTIQAGQTYKLSNDGVTIRFSNTYGHRAGDEWVFYNIVNDLDLGGSFSNPHAKNDIKQLIYTITIQDGSTFSSPNNANTYIWSNNAGESGGPVTILANQALPLNNGLVVRFDDANGHYAGDTWTFRTVEAPFDTNAAGTCTWYDWRPRGTARLSQTLNSGSSTAVVSSLMPFDVPCRVTLRDGSVQATARIISVNPTAFPPTVTFETPVSQTFTTNTVIDPGSGTYHLTTYSYMTEDERRDLSFHINDYGYKNFTGFENYGLSYLYYQYLTDKSVYLRSLNYLHCPTDIKNDRIDRTLQISRLQVNDLKDRRLYDPLQAGYNKYDFTYNYDQYINDIIAFDNALGYNIQLDISKYPFYKQDMHAIHVRRQLCDKNPPADTVVTWCFQHRGNLPASGPYYFNTEANTFLATDGKTYITPDGQPVGTPIAGVTNDQQADDKMAEYIKQRDVVLWLDGSSGTVTPQIVKSTVGKYYWLPTFLTSSAEQR